MYVVLVRTGQIPPDASNSDNDLEVAEMCLEALSITAAQIPTSEPTKTFKSATSQPFNDADKNNEMLKKVPVNQEYTNDDDPIYQVDQQPDNYVQRIREINERQNENNKKCLMFMASEIARLNLNPDLPGIFKLAQFETLTHYGD